MAEDASGLAEFIADEQPAIDQLRRLVGKGLAPRLDGSVPSLRYLDSFVANLTREADWYRSPLFSEISGDIRAWLAVRVAYYLGWCLREHYGVDWELSADRASPVYGTPTLRIRGIELSPLEVARELVAGDVEGGLTALFQQLEEQLRQTAH